MLVQGGNRPNVLLITIDTLRADRVGRVRLRAARTRRRSIASRRSGVRFADATAHAPLTYPSHVAILTGPLSGGVRHPRQRHGHAASGRRRRSPSGCRAAGYATGAVVASAVLDEALRPDRRVSRTTTIASPVPARATLSTAESAAARRSGHGWPPANGWRAAAEPWFLWVHYYDPHLPYDPAPTKFAALAPGRAVRRGDRLRRLRDRRAARGSRSPPNRRGRDGGSRRSARRARRA